MNRETKMEHGGQIEKQLFNLKENYMKSLIKKKVVLCLD